MNGFLLNTNTISGLVSIKPHQRVLDWMDAADENRLFLSVMTLGEIRQGVAALPQSKKRTLLETWLEVDLQSCLPLPLSITTSPPLRATSATLPWLDSTLSTLGRPDGSSIEVKATPSRIPLHFSSQLWGIEAPPILIHKYF